MNRRDFLQIGTAAGISLPTWLNANTVSPKANAVIQIYLPGGISHLDSFDYKILAPSEYQGPFKGIKTKIPGVYFSELFPEMAKVSDNITVINSMSHGEAAHERGMHNMLTGYRPSPAIKYPSFGSIISHELGMRNNIPPYVIVPNQFAPENGSGYLPSSFGPFAIGGNPEDKNFIVRDLNNPVGIDELRFNRRKSLLATVSEHFNDLEKNKVDALNAMDSFYQDAYKLVSSESAKSAFDLSKESLATKEKYGNNAAGMRLLLARRLVEAGTRMITVSYGSWDHHSNIRAGMTANAPNFDKAFAALILDLKERGLLDNTLVMVTSEFGRTSKTASDGGRNHQPSVFSSILAGGGIKKGFVYGKSDVLGGTVEENAVSPESFATTMYSLMGINPEKRLTTSDMRPIDIVRDGKPIRELMS
jgi:Protein of unknown function (DUF1501)